MGRAPSPAYLSFSIVYTDREWQHPNLSTRQLQTSLRTKSWLACCPTPSGARNSSSTPACRAGCKTGSVSRWTGRRAIPKGDIDALLCDPQHPGHAVAFQVKRIKFGIDQLRNRTPGKLQEYKKLAEQTNRLARMGFWQVYAYVVVVVDAREQNAGKITYDGLSSQLRSLVASTITTTPLDERVGLAHLEFNQPMDREPFTVGTHSLHRIRGSQPAGQSEELSRWVAEVFSRL